ncbi:MAG: SNF2-related protein [Spirochaetes bacterium]|nr:SNF2-related protein [Spirochaetota bacterium]
MRLTPYHAKYYWAERKRRPLVICPASIRKQWALELEEKFNIPTFTLDSNPYREALKAGRGLSSTKVGKGIRWATEDSRKPLVSATPLQNSLLELFGLSTLMDEQLYYDLAAFRAQITGVGANINALRGRLAGFCKRTLRKQVTEYVRFTERHAITRPFQPTDDEHKLYEAISSFIQRPEICAIPCRQRHLIQFILRKLLASSSLAIAGTPDTMSARLAPLSKSERHFVEDIKSFHDCNTECFETRDLYLLRNLSKGRSIGFFKAGNFYPDFILWLLAGGKQHVILVDPKGIRNPGWDDPKSRFQKTARNRAASRE